MTTITKDAAVVTPDLVLEYETATESTNVVHQIIGGGIGVSLGDDNPRAGKLEMFFLEREPAWAALELHKTAGVFVLDDAAIPELNMSYVRDGALNLRLDRDTRLRWILSVGYQEVLP